MFIFSFGCDRTESFAFQHQFNNKISLEKHSTQTKRCENFPQTIQLSCYLNVRFLHIRHILRTRTSPG